MLIMYGTVLEDTGAARVLPLFITVPFIANIGHQRITRRIIGSSEDHLKIRKSCWRHSKRRKTLPGS
jgi:hypothetical protein